MPRSKHIQKMELPRQKMVLFLGSCADIRTKLKETKHGTNMTRALSQSLPMDT